MSEAQLALVTLGLVGADVTSSNVRPLRRGWASLAKRHAHPAANALGEAGTE